MRKNEGIFLSFLDCNSFGFLILEAKMVNSDIKNIRWR